MASGFSPRKIERTIAKVERKLPCSFEKGNGFFFKALEFSEPMSEAFPPTF
jgi:hypothetical protein